VETTTIKFETKQREKNISVAQWVKKFLSLFLIFQGCTEWPEAAPIKEKA
jgi:hypothetical protein